MSDATGRRATLDTVAAAAGVSAAAVSLALRGKPGVAAATRQRIIDVADRLGYQSRPASPPPAESTIGLLLMVREPGPPESSYDPVIGAVTETCAGFGVDVTLGRLPVDGNDRPVDVPRVIGRAGIAGFLVLGPWLSRAAASIFGDRPVVLIDGDPEDRDTCSNVVSDDAGGVSDVTAALIARGHRRIVLAGTSEGAAPWLGERRRGYDEAMDDAGLAPIYVDGSVDDPEAVAAAVIAELRAPRPFTAVVAANDAVGLAVLAAAAGRGIGVPSELSIVGFDDTEAARLIRPRLTTVAVSKPAMGRLAASMLLHRIRRPRDPPFTAIQRARVVERDSVASPRPTRSDRRQAAAASRR